MHKTKLRLIILTLVTFLFMLHISSAAEPLKLQDVGIKLKALGLMVGDPDGSMRFQDKITRAEFATVSIKLMGKETLAASRKGPTKFKDVPKDHWATGFINVASDSKLINGYEDGTFKHDNTITYGEALTILVNTLGHGNDVSPEDWPNNFVQKAEQIGLTSGLKLDPSKPMTRGDVAILLNNSLTIPVKK